MPDTDTIDRDEAGELKPGIHPDVPADTYHRGWDACSNSRLSELARSPAHCRYAIDHPEPPTPALLLGDAIDCAVLTPDLFGGRFLHAGRCVQVKRGGDRCENPGKALIKGDWFCGMHTPFGIVGRDIRTILHPADWDICMACQAAVWNHPVARTLLDNRAQVQASAVWTDDATGQLCKARADVLCPALETVVDLKSTMDAGDDFSRSIWKWGYHRQGAFYLDGFNALGGSYSAFAFIAVEKCPPYAVAVYDLEPEAINAGRRELHEEYRGVKPGLIERYAECARTGAWPGYNFDRESGDYQAERISIPKWAMPREPLAI